MSDNNSKKRKYTSRTVAQIRRQGAIMSLKCSNCVSLKKECVVAKNSARCAECFKNKKSCDVRGPSEEGWKLLEGEEEKLRVEEEKLQREEEETLAKMLRLKRLARANREKQASFRSRASHMLQLGLKSLEELDAWEEKERKENEAVVKGAAPADDPSVPPSSPGVIFDFPSPSASFWESLNAGGETPQATQGN